MPFNEVKVSHLKAGDFVRARFEGLNTEYGDHGYASPSTPTGMPFELSGFLFEHDWGTAGLGPSLDVREQNTTQVVRQSNGQPGAWLIEILEHIPAP